MKSVITFVKTTLIGGVLFLVPLVATTVILSKALRYVAQILLPVEHMLPRRTIVGLAVADVLAIVCLLAIGFFSGLVAQTGLGKRFSRRIEELILGKIPGYTLLRGIIGDPENIGGNHELKVALARIDDAWLFSFIVEELPNGMLAVFVPSAPTPTAGNVYMMTEQQVRRLDVPVAAATKCIMQLGVGAGKLLNPTQMQKGGTPSAGT
jgi:uncharacterized membrane protein